MIAGSSGVDTATGRLRRKRAEILPGVILDELVVEILGATSVPLSAYAIVDHLRELGRSGNVMATYRSLDRLAKREVVERVESLSAYRLRTAAGAVLMACSVCGTTAPLGVATYFEAIEDAVRKTGFQLDKLALEAVGLCERCRSG